MSNARRLFGQDFNLLTPGQARFLIDLAGIPMNATQPLTVRGHHCGIERHEGDTQPVGFGQRAAL